MPVAARTARYPGWNLHFVSARRFLGCLDRRLGFHLSELCDRRRFGCSVRLFWRSQANRGNLLRCQPGGYRADPPFLLAAFEAWHGGQVAMGGRASLFGRNGDPPGGGRVAVYWRGTRRHPLLRQSLSAPAAASSPADRRAATAHACPRRYCLDLGQACAVLS